MEPVNEVRTTNQDKTSILRLQICCFGYVRDGF